MLKALSIGRPRFWSIASLRAFSVSCSVRSILSTGVETASEMFEDWTQKDIKDQTGKTFLITGSTAGLGFTAAKVLAEKKGHVILAARNPDRLLE